MNTTFGRVKPVDVFIAFNLLLFLLMCFIVYYERFRQYRGPGNIHEFFLYAFLLTAGIFWGWKYFRHYSLPVYLLLLIQLGVLLHFAGGLMPVNGGRLYDTILFDIRFDKIVHFVNAFIGAVLANHLFNVVGVEIPRFRGIVLILIVLGFGAIIEIVEYLVMLTIPNSGVGGYDNNMMDLIANFMGCGCFVLGRSFVFAVARNRNILAQKITT